MPYPRTFTPNFVATVRDDRGHTETPISMQVFKPMLGCNFNGQQSLISGHKLPNMAGVVLRGLMRVPSDSLLSIKPGPQYWGTGLVPNFSSLEDPNGLKWWIFDAFPWGIGVADRLWSFFAATDFLPAPLPPPPPPPPPPGPPTPVALGPTPALATLISLNVLYSTALPMSSLGYTYLPLTTGTPYTLHVTTASSSTVSLPLGGNHLGLVSAEGPPLTGVGTTVVTVHTGPDLVIGFNNPTAFNDFPQWSVTSP